MLEENVQAVPSRGSSCFACDRATTPRELVVQMTFRVALFPVTVEAHEKCWISLRSMIDKKIKAAKDGYGGKSHGR